VVALADVLRRFAQDYLSAHGASVLPSHRRAVADILACRTEQLGGHLWRCACCRTEVFSYHSCKNRSCPRCHKDQTERWIAARKAELLACPYFQVTVTVPEELRDVLRANQRDGYAALMRAAAEGIIELARDPHHVGGTVGVMAVLHTWTQQLVYHPHVHCLVTGGGFSDDGRHWRPARWNYLIPTKALAVLVRAKMKAALARSRPDLVLPKAAWSKPWVVDCTAWGDGAERCCTTSPAMCSVLPSPRAASSGSTTSVSPSATGIVHRGNGARRFSVVTSSCAASCSTCCQRASTRCDTPASGIQAVATQLHEP